MPRRTSSAASLLLLIFSVLTTLSSAIKFDLSAATHPHTKCIWNYALSDSLVIVTASVIAKEPFDFTNQRVDIEVVDGSKHNNVYLSKKSIKGETRLAINTHSHADLGVCFKNTQTGRSGSSGQVPVVTIDLDVDIGADAVDYNAIANQESLSGLETELRKLEAVANEIVNEMEYLKKRELRMADTNLSTNMRVTNFAIVTLLALIALGVWQVFHLRGFFKRKYLID
ncbi:Emp24/gp25L/p24 membrane trafficking protein [Pseudozyma hubeiensis SY62]|uniref:Emp24/gp25L/p24 membrane trafficking protein n=1 Tax=Pseudozyma hubeiensis (strain SY62) TaxID=1305764 RepID=R9PCT5_PSEHS|nr:Emp24/gp25L/p24 membrane trafficking protein [Pseudozyma hubeiensis SY62]GAC99208.1 Emp24/gp25L/p24 membrane trafficking protein [Pseudozyma hubeiensis SY62]